MARKVNSLPFSRLDTIMETSETEESNNSLDSALPQKQLTAVAIDGEKTQEFSTSRRKRTAAPSRRIRNRTAEEQERVISQECTLADEPFVTIKNEARIRTHKINRTVKKTQTDTLKVPDMAQVEMLFPDFFPKRTSAYCGWQPGELTNTDHQNNTNLLKGNGNEDPLVRSWLNLFGARVLI